MARIRKDIEDIQDDFVAVLKAGYNTRLKEIDDSKSVQLNFPEIKDDDYYDTMDVNVTRSSFLLYGVDNSEPVQAGEDVQELVTLFFIACYSDTNDLNFNRAMLRVQRALKDVLRSAWKNEIRNDFTIIKTEPLLISDDSGEWQKATGVYVQVAI